SVALESLRDNRRSVPGIPDRASSCRAAISTIRPGGRTRRETGPALQRLRCARQRWAFGASFTDSTGVTWTLDRPNNAYEGSGTTWANYVNGTRFIARNGRRLTN